MKQLFLMFVCSLLILGGCKDNPAAPASQFTPPPVVSKAVYVLNEGNYSDANGARLTLYDYDSKKVYRDVFENTHSGQHLGSVGDDMMRVGDKLYILMSHSNNIVILHLQDYRTIATSHFDTLKSPHDLAIDTLRHRLFFTNLFGNTITATNDTTLSVIKDIGVGANPEGLAIADSRLWVCNTGFGADSTVSVINLNTLAVETTMVLSVAPTSAAVSSDGRVLIACSGDTVSKGSVYVINPATFAVEKKIQFSVNLFYQSGTMAADANGNVFVISADPNSFYGGPVEKINLAGYAVTMNYIGTGDYYGVGINPSTGELYASDVKNFAADAVVSIYSSAGTLNARFTAERGASLFAFR